MQLILWPALATLAITLLRLTGELQAWSPTLFNAAPGGGGALVGISWLPIVFGPYFAWKLTTQGKGAASPARAAGLALFGLAVAVAAFAAVGRLHLGVGALLGAFVLALALAFLPWAAWPELGRTLFTYALAARVPVTIVMLAAIFGSWGTHYDVLPDNPPAALVAAGPLQRWFWIGLIPQMTIWIAQTVLLGTVLGAGLVAVIKPKRA